MRDVDHRLGGFSDVSEKVQDVLPEDEQLVSLPYAFLD